MPHGFGHAVSGDQVGHAETHPTAIGQEFRILHHLADALSEVTDPAHLLGLIRLEVAIEDPFLRMPDATGLGHGNDLLARVHVEIAASSVIVLE